jgi:hypothetical protein
MRPFTTFVLVCALFAAVLGACAESDQTGTDGDPYPLPAPVCGDGLCAGPEVGSCVADCGMPSTGPRCGNGKCENGESNASCAADCPAQSQCGNGTCDAGETTGNCAGDCPAQGNCPTNPFACATCASLGILCPAGHNRNTCTACILSGGGGTCSGGFPNGTCDAGENPTNCPFDCM